MKRIIEKALGLFAISYGICMGLIGIIYISHGWMPSIGIISGCCNIMFGVLFYKGDI